MRGHLEVGRGGEPDPEAVSFDTADGPAAEVVAAHLRAQLAQLVEWDPRVRRDEHDSVHKMRVATRRLRSALRTFEPLVGTEGCSAVRVELAWLAGSLGEARDAEVMRDRMAGLARGQGDEVPGGSHLADELEATLTARYVTAHAAVLETLDSTRYLRLLEALDDLVDPAAWSAQAAQPAAEVLPPLVRHDFNRVKMRAKRVDRAASTAKRDEALHEVRKAAKRLRYAAEALAPAFGQPAADLAGAAEELQEVLGDHQDSVVSQALLRELADRDDVSGDVAIVLGRLHLLEQGHAERSARRYETAWRALRERELRRWLG